MQRVTRSAAHRASQPPLPVMPAPAVAAVAPDNGAQALPVPPILMADPIFAGLLILRGLNPPAMLPPSDATMKVIEHFVSFRGEQTPRPADGVLEAAENYRYSLLTTRITAATNAPILAAIAQLSARVDAQIQGLNDRIDNLGNSISWQRAEDIGRRTNRAHTLSNIPWVPVRSHIDGRLTPDAGIPPITSRPQIDGLDDEAVNRWLEMYGLPSGAGSAANKAFLGDFLGGATL
ncbi:hypothetical protein IAU59_004132 [Kwoniella sp. CBS 9459]